MLPDTTNFIARLPQARIAALGLLASICVFGWKATALEDLQLTENTVWWALGGLMAASIGAGAHRWSESRHRSVELQQQINLRLMDAFRGGIFILDDQGCITECNSGARRLTGMQRSKCIGRRLDDVLPNLGDFDVADCVRLALSGSESACHTHRSNGIVEPLDVYCSPLKEGNQLVGALCLIDLRPIASKSETRVLRPAEMREMSSRAHRGTGA